MSYSTLRLVLAAGTIGRRVMSFGILPESCALAREVESLAGVDQILEWIADVAPKHIASFSKNPADFGREYIEG